MDLRILAPIATVTDFCTDARERHHGPPLAATVRVLATLRRCLREGTPWRSLRANAEQASGSTLRRHLQRRARQGLLARVHAVMARLRSVFADKGYDAERHRDLCHEFGVASRIHRRGQPHASGLRQRRWPVERSNAWVLENRRLAPRCDRLGFIVQSLLQAACIFLVAPRVAREL
jgi:transposase